MNWKNKKVLITGGASFIGSHLSEQLIKLGAKIRIAENFSSGEIKHLENVDCELVEGNLLDSEFCDQATKGMEVVFHLAADHGGRGYIDSHPVECSTNMILDGQVFRHAHQNGAEKIVFASSGCVYPTSAQMEPKITNKSTQNVSKMVPKGSTWIQNGSKIGLGEVWGPSWPQEPTRARKSAFVPPFVPILLVAKMKAKTHPKAVREVNQKINFHIRELILSHSSGSVRKRK